MRPRIVPGSPLFTERPFVEAQPTASNATASASRRRSSPSGPSLRHGHAAVAGRRVCFRSPLFTERPFVEALAARHSRGWRHHRSPLFTERPFVEAYRGGRRGDLDVRSPLFTERPFVEAGGGRGGRWGGVGGRRSSPSGPSLRLQSSGSPYATPTVSPLFTERPFVEALRRTVQRQAGRGSPLFTERPFVEAHRRPVDYSTKDNLVAALHRAALR